MTAACDKDLRALRNEALCRGETDSAGASGDDCYFSFQLTHIRAHLECSLIIEQDCAQQWHARYLKRILSMSSLLLICYFSCPISARLAQYIATILFGMAVQAAGGASRSKLQPVVEMALTSRS